MAIVCLFFFSSRRRHTRCSRDWSSDVCSSDLAAAKPASNWNIAANIAGEFKGSAFCRCEEFCRCLSNHWIDRAALVSADGYIVVKRKRHPEAIETGAEIRSAGGNT